MTFYVGNVLFGLSLQEFMVVPFRQPEARVPSSSPAVLGATSINDRDHLVVDLRVLFCESVESTGETTMVLVQHGGKYYALVVDSFDTECNFDRFIDAWWSLDFAFALSPDARKYVSTGISGRLGGTQKGFYKLDLSRLLALKAIF